MALKGINLYLTHLGGMGFATMKLYVPHDPVTVSLLGAICLMMVAQHLTGLVH